MYTSDYERTEAIIDVLLYGDTGLAPYVTLDLYGIGAGAQAKSCGCLLAQSFVYCHGPERRQLYCLALVALGTDACIEAVGDIMRNDPDPTVRIAAIYAAQVFDIQTFVASLFYASSLDKHGAVRRAADFVLSNLEL